ncbi:hypothetical protein Tsubulata_004812, partial [Turnera subulata]
RSPSPTQSSPNSVSPPRRKGFSLHFAYVITQKLFGPVDWDYGMCNCGRQCKDAQLILKISLSIDPHRSDCWQ